MKFKWVYDANMSDLQLTWGIRRQVFVEEQNVAIERELDGHDEDSTHIIVFIDQKPVATARLQEGPARTLVIQRVAVLSQYRGQNIGKQMMQEIERWARSERKFDTMELSSQDHVIGFYEKLGFQTTNDEGYLDANIPHHRMIKRLNESHSIDTATFL